MIKWFITLDMSQLNTIRPINFHNKNNLKLSGSFAVVFVEYFNLSWRYIFSVYKEGRGVADEVITGTITKCESLCCLISESNYNRIRSVKDCLKDVSWGYWTWGFSETRLLIPNTEISQRYGEMSPRFLTQLS